ncbi:integrase domain-containing protein [Undibacterium sp. RTI2.1]|uniref:integrase domain-containing protein n=1 Tax=unclassified Undibacterium TaxID=2630295 RepID=UPI002B23314F|nr:MULTISPECIES: integrase domain-containing protein [unclassified Undibacterium]MEB0032983.1 integrase domain-containing protein [Undibacterium sp. RTI2.1]MEB0118844.1 integrase domain-containing protein [Undibacterium sp. RTI2.2]
MALNYDHTHDVKRAKLPQALKDELSALFPKHIHRAHSKTRQSKAALGAKTQRLRCLCMVASIEELYTVGKFEIASLSNLKEKHINFLVTHWVSKKQTRGTIENKLTYLSTLATWLRKANIVKNPESYPSLCELPKRSGIVMEDKSWESNGVDAQELIGRITMENKYIGIQLMLQITFGLRAEESMLMRPFDTVMRLHGETYLMVEDGTKGGRHRRVEIDDESQLEIIETAKQYINNKSKTTIPNEFSLKQWKSKYYNILRKYGLTKKGLGVTPHGLRSQYLNNLYKNLTGKDSPVRGGTLPQKDILESARKIIAEHAGHSLASKSNAYIGSHAAIKLKTSKDITNDQILKSMEEAEGNKMKAAQMLGCARSYLYKRLKEMELVNE